MRLLRPVLILSVIALFATASIASAVALNEYRLDQPSTDNDEYVELIGAPQESLDDLFFIVIGDGLAADLSGVVEEITPLTGYAIQADGFFVIAEDTWTGTLGGTVDLTTNISLVLGP